jgi:hypothetical protein
VEICEGEKCEGQVVGKGKFIDPEQINRLIDLVSKASEKYGLSTALVGGVAMQVYGSDRLTKDLDIVSDQPIPDPSPLKRTGPLHFGGDAYQAPDGSKLDVIVRNDEFTALYQEALANAITTPEGIPIVTPEYLAAMKLGAGTDKHLLDLKWLIKQPDLLDVKKAENIVYRTMGGKFAQDIFRKIVDLALLEKEQAKRAGEQA